MATFLLLPATRTPAEVASPYISTADAKWQNNRAWTAACAALEIHFGDRFPG
jgi:hypothetical protein